jgi:hypothetical protein
MRIHHSESDIRDSWRRSMTDREPIMPGLVSPSLAPFQFTAWIELPFPVVINIHKIIECKYSEDITTSLSISIQSDMLKLVTGSRARQRIETSRWLKQAQSAGVAPREWVLEYVHENEVEAIEKKLRSEDGTAYIHIEEIPAVVQLDCTVPDEVVPNKSFAPRSLIPRVGFFQEEIYPQLQSIIDQYRIAAFPWMRYEILPIIDERVLLDIHDNSTKRIWREYRLFKSTEMLKRIGNEYEPVQRRYDRMAEDQDSHQAENQFAAAYYLFHLQRWAEALAIASSVVDNLLKTLIDMQIPNKAVADWVNLSRDEVYTKLLPSFNIPRLCDVDQSLWKNFKSARKERGSKVHGQFSNPKNDAQSAMVKQHLRAFYGVAKWLTECLGKRWALEVTEIEEQLGSFP